MPKPSAIRKAAEEGPVSAAVREEQLQPRNTYLCGTVLAFALGENEIQVAVATHLGPRKVLRSAETLPRPADGESAAAPAEFARRTVERYLEKYSQPGLRVVLTVSGKETAFRTFLLPVLKRTDLGDAVRVEASRQLPFAERSFQLDYRPVTKVTGNNRKRFKVAVLAATDKLIEEHLQPVNRAGARAHHIYHAADVVGQLLPCLPDFTEDRAYILLRIGAATSEIAFYRGSLLEFTHHTNTGAAMLGEDTDGTRTGFFAETLAGEVHTGFDYYSGQHTLPTAPSLLVYGALADREAVLAALEDRIGFACRSFPAAELQSVQIRGASPAGIVRALPATAAALNTATLPSLLPDRERKILQRRRIDGIGRIAVALVLALMAASWLYFNRDLQTEREHTLALQRQVSMFRASEAYRAYHQLQGQISQANDYISRTQKDPTYLGLNLKELTHVTPVGVRLSRYDFSREGGTDELRLAGTVTSSDIPPEVILAEYIEQLKASPFYEGVRVERHVKRQRDGRFEIDFQLVMRGVA